MRLKGLCQYVEIAPLAGESVYRENDVTGVRCGTTAPVPVRQASGTPIACGGTGDRQELELG